MKVLLLASLTSETGNFSTAERIQRCLSDCNIDCRLRCISCFSDGSSVKKFVSAHALECVIGIHAWRAGRLLLDCPVPFAIIFGGTDLNVHPKDKEKLETMSKIAEKASHLVAFSNPMRKQALALWPKSKEKIILQPQAVHVGPSGFKLRDHFRQINNPSIRSAVSNGCHSCQDSECSDLIVFILVAGLRRVKDPLYLAPSIAEWHKEDHRIHLIIVGPELDTEFAKEVKSEIQRLPGVVLIPPLPACDLHAAIQDSFAVINSSTSEGMASAVLESMKLGVPVLARDIPGNAAVIKHRESGLLFDTPQEFVKLAKELMNSPSLRTRLTANAKTYICEHHSTENERNTYKWIVDKLVSLQYQQTTLSFENSNEKQNEA